MTDAPSWLSATTGGLVLDLYVQPGAKRTAIVGCHGDRLKIAVAAPARDGEATRRCSPFWHSGLG